MDDMVMSQAEMEGDSMEELELGKLSWKFARSTNLEKSAPRNGKW
jgi:hypothetical protein